MNSIWLSLLWKEWCEFRWKMAALTASFVVCQSILMNIFFMGQPMRDMAAGLVVSMLFCLIVYGVLAGAFVGMSVAAGENSRRTMRFTQALPIPMWQAALARVLLGLVTVVLPIVAVVGLIWTLTWYVWDDQTEINEVVLSQIGNVGHPWGIANYFVGRSLAAVVGVSSLLLWFAACGVNRADEVRAGAVAFLICSVLWGVLFYGTEENVLGLRDFFETISVGLAGGPALSANFGYRPLDKSIPLLATIALFSHGLILAYFVTRYGLSTGLATTGGKQFLTDWFRFRGARGPFRSQTLAIIWKQACEVGPLAMLAVAGILAFTAFTYVADDPGRWHAHDWSNLLGGLTLVVCGFMTLVSGIGVIYEDYSRGLPNFWRSRPINLHQWFFLKYATGVLVLVLAFVPPILIAGWLKDWQMATKDDVLMCALIFLTLYAGSLAIYALVRQPIYAVVLTIAAVWLTPGILFSIRRLLPYREYNDEKFMFVLLGLSATILAWQAVVHDWGWKQSR